MLFLCPVEKLESLFPVYLSRRMQAESRESLAFDGRGPLYYEKYIDQRLVVQRKAI